MAPAGAIFFLRDAVTDLDGRGPLACRVTALSRLHEASSMPTHRLPADHPLRRGLAEEAHARPPALVEGRAVVSVLALMDTPAELVLEAVLALARSRGAEAEPPPGAAHVVVVLPALRIKWERHGEFCSLTLVAPLAARVEDLDGMRYPSAFDAVPADWLSTLPGRVIAACDIVVLPVDGRAGRPCRRAPLRVRHDGRLASCSMARPGSSPTSSCVKTVAAAG